MQSVFMTAQFELGMPIDTVADVYAGPFSTSGGSEKIGSGTIQSTGLMCANVTFPTAGSFYIYIVPLSPTGVAQTAQDGGYMWLKPQKTVSVMPMAIVTSLGLSEPVQTGPIGLSDLAPMGLSEPTEPMDPMEPMAPTAPMVPTDQVAMGPMLSTSDIMYMRLTNVGINNPAYAIRIGLVGLYESAIVAARDRQIVDGLSTAANLADYAENKLAAVASGVIRTTAGGATANGTALNQLTKDEDFNSSGVALPYNASVTYKMPSSLSGVRYIRFKTIKDSYATDPYGWPTSAAAATAAAQRLKIEFASTDGVFSEVQALTVTNIASSGGTFVDGTTLRPNGLFGTGTLRLVYAPFVSSVTPLTAQVGTALSLQASVAGLVSSGTTSFYASDTPLGTKTMITATNGVSISISGGIATATGTATFPASGPKYLSCGNARGVGPSACVRVGRTAWTNIGAGGATTWSDATCGAIPYTSVSYLSWMIDVTLTPQAASQYLWCYMTPVTSAASPYVLLCSLKLVELSGSLVYLEATYYKDSTSYTVVGTSSDAIKHTGRVRVAFSYDQTVSPRFLLDVGTGRLFKGTFDTRASYAAARAYVIAAGSKTDLYGISTCFGMPHTLYITRGGTYATVVPAIEAAAYRSNIALYDLRCYLAYGTAYANFTDMDIFNPPTPAYYFPLSLGAYTVAGTPRYNPIDLVDEGAMYEFPSRVTALTAVKELVVGDTVQVTFSFIRAPNSRIYVYTAASALKQCGTAVGAFGITSITVPCTFTDSGPLTLYVRAQSPFVSALMQPNFVPATTTKPLFVYSEAYQFPSAASLVSVSSTIELTSSTVTVALNGASGTDGATVEILYAGSVGATRSLGSGAVTALTVNNITNMVGALTCKLPAFGAPGSDGKFTISAIVTSPAGVVQDAPIVCPTKMTVTAFSLPSAASGSQATLSPVFGVSFPASITLTGTNADKLTAACVSARFSTATDFVAATNYVSSNSTTGVATVTLTANAVGPTTIIVRVANPAAGSSTYVTLSFNVVVQGPPVTLATSSTVAYGSRSAIVIVPKDSAGNVAAFGASGSVAWVKTTTAPLPILVTDSTGAIVGTVPVPRPDDAVVAIPFTTPISDVSGTAATIVATATSASPASSAVYYGACTSFSSTASVVVSGFATNAFGLDWTFEALVFQSTGSSTGTIFQAGLVTLSTSALTYGTTSVALTVPSAWTHVAVVRYNGTTTVYLNGAVAATTTAVLGFEVTQFTLGTGTGSSGFTGRMSDARLYQRAKYTAPFSGSWLAQTTLAASDVATTSAAVTATFSTTTYRPTFVAVKFASGIECSTLVATTAYVQPTTIAVTSPATAFRTASVTIAVSMASKGGVVLYAGASGSVVGAATLVDGKANVTCAFPTSGTFTVTARAVNEENAIQTPLITSTSSVVVSDYALPSSVAVVWDSPLVYGVTTTGTATFTGSNVASLAKENITVSVGTNVATTTSYSNAAARLPSFLHLPSSRRASRASCALCRALRRTWTWPPPSPRPPSSRVRPSTEPRLPCSCTTRRPRPRCPSSTRQGPPRPSRRRTCATLSILLARSPFSAPTPRARWSWPRRPPRPRFRTSTSSLRTWCARSRSTSSQPSTRRSSRPSLRPEPPPSRRALGTTAQAPRSPPARPSS
jgi:hypothetical protein